MECEMDAPATRMLENILGRLHSQSHDGRLRKNKESEHDGKLQYRSILMPVGIQNIINAYHRLHQREDQ